MSPTGRPKPVPSRDEGDEFRRAEQDGEKAMPGAAGGSDDLSALAWVHDELRRSLEAAHKSLRRFVREAEAVGVSDLDAVDPAVLRGARAQIHQGVGALELVGLPAAAAVLRASEALVQRAVAKPHRLTAAAVELIEQASFGLLDYLSRLLAGRPVSPLSLFPQYRAVLEAAGAERVHPADLCALDWAWRELPNDAGVAPLQTDATSRAALEGQLLTLMKTAEPRGPAARMSDICAGLARGTEDAPQTATFWNLAAAVFEAQAQGLLAIDVFGKRVASRLLAQFRTLERGQGEVSERLAQDLLFFCAQSQSPADGQAAPRLAAVRQVYGLAEQALADYNASPLGRFDPALILQARKRVAAAKEAWSAVAGGEMHRLTGLSEQFALVGDSLKRLFPHGEVFSAALQQAVAQTQQAASAPPAPLAMEVATSLLYIEAVLEDGDFDHPEQAERVRRLAERLHGVRRGGPPDPLESWMEELYRRVADRQTMGSVVQELRASLSEVEASIDKFFRDPARHEVLMSVPSQLSSMRGVLSVLGMDHAASALLGMRQEVDGMISAEAAPPQGAQAGVFDRLAGNLGALGFLIDMLSVQPQMAKTLFRYDAATGVLSPVMGREPPPALADRPALPSRPVAPRLVEQVQSLAFSSVRTDIPLEAVSRDIDRLSREAIAAEQPALVAAVQKAREAIDEAGDDEAGLVAARGELSESLVDFVHSTIGGAALEQPAPANSAAIAAAIPAAIPAAIATPGAPAAVDSGLGDDPEMREVFLEEAGEVLAEAEAAQAGLRDRPDDLSLVTSLRRAFHTLKGSSRMVGLKEFGEAAWACEQLYNTQLADQKPAGVPLLAFTAESLAYLADWALAIAAGRRGEHDAAVIQRAAEQVAHPDAAPAEEPALLLPLGLPPDLPTAADLDLASWPVAPPLAAEPVATAREAGATAGADEPIAFELDLSAFDLPLDLPETGSVPAAPQADTAESLSWTFEPLAVPTGVAAASGAVGAATPEPAAAEFELEPPGEPEGDEPELLLDFDLPEVIEGDVESAAPGVEEPVALAETLAGTEASPAADAPTLAAATGDAPLAVADDEPVAVADEPPSDEPPLVDTAERTDADLLSESVKVVGPLRIGIPLFNIYLNEADELSRRLCTEVAEWSMELHRPIGEMPIALAHSLAGSSATVGFVDLSQLARSLEHAQARSQAIGPGTAEEGRLFVDAADEIRHLLHQFAAGFLRSPTPELLARLADHERSSALRLDAATAAAERPPSGEATEPAAPTELSEPSQPREPSQLREPSQPSQPSQPSEPSEPVVASEFISPGESGAPTEPVASGEFGAPVESADSAGPVDRREPIEAAQPMASVEPAPIRPAALPADFQPADFQPADFKPFGEAPLEPSRPVTPFSHELVDADAGIDAVDAIDAELFPIFAEEAEELLPQLASRLRDWSQRPADAGYPSACMRTLHTLKGGARLAGAMRLGEMAHQLETRIERLLALPAVSAADVERLQHHADALSHSFDASCRGDRRAQRDAELEFADAGLPSGGVVAPALPLVAARGPADVGLSRTAPVEPVEAPAVGRTLGAADAPSLAVGTPIVPETAPAPAAGVDLARRDEHVDHADQADQANLTDHVDLADPVDRLLKVDDADPARHDDPEPDTLAARIAEALDDLATIQPPTPPSEAPATAPPAPVAALGQTSTDPAPIDWSRFASGAEPLPRAADPGSGAQSSVRVRAPVLDRLVNQAGEVSITRSRIESGVAQIKQSLADLTENLDRLRSQLRDIEFHGEVQMTSRMEAAKAAAESFDPLEFDRFTRFQELTRMMAESVNDVATVQRTVQRALETTEDELVAQSRLTRDLQDDLLRTRMVEFEGLSDRLYRVVRQAAKETGKSVRLDIVGGRVEVDRGVLDRMTGAFEHLLRNSVTHGIETPQARTAAGKEATGSVVLALTQEGNEVGVEFRDDGAGLDLQRIRARGVALGLVEPDATLSDAELAQLIFLPGFSTADGVTELAGRGVGMDVVRSEVDAVGGRIETATSAGRGTSFRLILPLTTAVTQVVMLRCGDLRVAVPSTLVEAVQRLPVASVDEAHGRGSLRVGDAELPFYWLGALLQISPRPAANPARTRMVVVVRSAQQRIALQVDEVVGNQEVVVKNLGPQLSRMPGLAGVTLLASGSVTLIYNPVALGTLYGETAQAATQAALRAAASAVDSGAGGAVGTPPSEPEAPLLPLVMVVDDSLTVRRVTQRLLIREGFRVVLAKDGLDALERLTEEVPQIVLSDIEMPRMDGFDLVRNMRADARLRDLPVIMITSRIAQKHRDHAAELGVDHYLGKPYAEEDLLALVSRYTAHAPAMAGGRGSSRLASPAASQAAASEAAAGRSDVHPVSLPHPQTAPLTTA